jgi:Subtilase family
LADRILPHFVLNGVAKSEVFKGRSGRGTSRPSDVADRRGHANRILTALDQIQTSPNASATYLEIVGRAGEAFDAGKFDVSGLSLLRIEEGNTDRRIPARMTVMASVQQGGIEKLRNKITDFADRDGRPGKDGVTRPKNADLVQSIDIVTEAGLRDLWRHPVKPFPDIIGPTDWEIWLNPEEVDRFVQQAPQYGIIVYGDRLAFPEDVVVIATCSADQLARAVRSIGAVRGVAQPGRPVDFVDTMEAEEQVLWVENLAGRTQIAQPANGVNSYVTILDTGISRNHPLIQPVLATDDRYTAIPSWDLSDLHGHGTAMAGVAIYGDLRQLLEGGAPIVIGHRLESSKVVPDGAQNPHHLLGDRTMKAVNAAEVEPSRVRTFTLATTTDQDSPHSGAPTSWSTEIDQLVAGVSGIVRQKRLIVISAGNIPVQDGGVNNYLSFCDHSDGEIFSPSQAWNSISVGAMTEKNGVGGVTFGTTLAPVGDLAPVSRTASWTSTWPIKPDIVMEGGNWFAERAIQTPNTHPDLMLVTTSKDHPQRSFTGFADTSAATALAARDLAILRAQYPQLWPETIRALYVGSARWTNQMWSHVPISDRAKKGALSILFKRYGYGKPDLERALASAASAITLIVQDEIRPYENVRSARRLHEMRLIELPWPINVLRELGNTIVTLRISLSTFFSPNPSEAARGRKLRYASHGLRFKLKGADETVPQFLQRVGRAVIDEDAQPVEGPDSAEWTFGAIRRDVGSLHIDSIKVQASDLARRGYIAIHPVGGWWKDSKRINPAECVARYGLVVEIDSPEGELYTEIAAKIPVAINV